MQMLNTVRISGLSVLASAVLGLSLAVESSPASAQLLCEGMAARAFGDALVVSAVSIPGGSFTAPDGIAYESVPSFCKVSAVANPTQDSLINIEVWLPTLGW